MWMRQDQKREAGIPSSKLTHAWSLNLVEVAIEYSLFFFQSCLNLESLDKLYKIHESFEIRWEGFVQIICIFLGRKSNSQEILHETVLSPTVFRFSPMNADRQALCPFLSLCWLLRANTLLFFFILLLRKCALSDILTLYCANFWFHFILLNT